MQNEPSKRIGNMTHILKGHPSQYRAPARVVSRTRADLMNVIKLDAFRRASLNRSF